MCLTRHVVPGWARELLILGLVLSALWPAGRVLAVGEPPALWRSVEGASRSTVRVDVSAFEAGALRLEVGDGKVLGVDKLRVQRRGEGDFSWFGTLARGPGSATFVVKDGRVTGAVVSAEGVYEVRPAESGLHVLTRLDPAALPPAHPASFREVASIPKGTERFSLLDLLVAHTSSARASRPDVEALSRLAVDQANRVAERQGLRFRFRLARVLPVEVPEAGGFEKELARLGAPGDGALKELPAQRDRYAADGVLLVVGDSSACSLPAPVDVGARSAFAVVSAACLSSPGTLVDVLGHLLGCGHASGATPAFCDAASGVASVVADFRTGSPLLVTGRVRSQGQEEVSFQGGEWAGTREQPLRLEGFSVGFAAPVEGLGLEYQCHVQDLGDLTWRRSGAPCGTRRPSRRLEGIAFRLTGSLADRYDVYYGCHVMGGADLGPFKNGEFCGTRGQSKPLSALVVWVTPRGSVGLRGSVRLEGLGERAFQQDEYAGTRGQSRRMTDFTLSLSPATPGLGVESACYLDGVSEAPWHAAGQSCVKPGSDGRLEGFALRLTGPAAATQDIHYLCHVEGIGDMGPVKNGALCGTRGQSRRVEGLYVWVSPKQVVSAGASAR